MLVEYITHLGSDLLVVNAARVSFDKQHEAFETNDVGLIKYLASHGHFTPFTHPQITLRVTAPIFVRTQCFKSKVGFTENEVSRRYVDTEPEFHVPNHWRRRAANKKQGSSDELVTTIDWHFDGPLKIGAGGNIHLEYEQYCQDARRFYNVLIGNGVAPEQARMVLPQSLMTSWFWTGSLAAYARFYKLRSGADAQEEIRDLAGMVAAEIAPLFPISWEALS